jgi:hypothetical protein
MMKQKDFKGKISIGTMMFEGDLLTITGSITFSSNTKSPFNVTIPLTTEKTKHIRDYREIIESQILEIL